MAAVELTVAALLAMTTNLQASVAAMEKLDFERATAAATQLIDATNAPPHIAEAARIIRARANLRGGRAPEAMKDLDWVRANGISEGLRAEASGELGKAGGLSRSSTRSVRTPRREWSMLLSLVARGDGEAALQRVQGPLRRMVDALDGLTPAAAGSPPRPGAGLLWAVNEWRNAKAAETLEGDTGKLVLERNGLRMTLAARSAGDAWVFHDLVSMERLEAGEPAEAAAMAAVAAPNAQIAVHLAGGNAMAFGGGGVAVINGRVIQLGGGFINNVQIQADTTAKAVVTNVPPVNEAQRGEIEALIRNLGAAEAATRAKARAALKELGPSAHAVLKEHRADADVEIATTVRELMGE